MSRRSRFAVLVVVAAASLLPTGAFAAMQGSSAVAATSVSHLQSRSPPHFNRATKAATFLERRPTAFEVPATLEIRTVPAMEGIQFALDGRAFETDEQGAASLRVWRGGTHQLEVLPLPSEAGERRLEFSRWGDAVFTTQRPIVIDESTSLEAGFDVYYPVKLGYVDLEGSSVASDRISSAVLKNSIGDVYTIAGEETAWLQASRILGRDLNLDPAEIVYTVNSVTIDGSNVVNRGQQRFVLEPDLRPQIELLLYSAKLSANDALFGFPIGRGMQLEYPDGRQEYFPFESGSELRLNTLARGTYRVSAVTGLGIAPASVFVLSRDQEVQAIVISALDLGVVALLAVALLLGLLLAGRPQLRGRLRAWIRRKAAPSITAILVLLMSLIPVGAARAQPAEDPIPVLAYYYIWFDPGSWERAKSDIPLLGPYSSDDAQVMRQHIQWAKQVGIDGFIVSWKSTDPLNRRLEQLIGIAEQEDFKLSIIYQGLDFERRPLPVERIAADLDYFLRSYADREVFDLYGLPVVIWSGTWEFSREEIATVVDPLRGRLQILASERQLEDYEAIADVVDGNAYYWSSVDPARFPGYQDKLDGMGDAVHVRGGLWIAPAAPGFDARLIEGTRVIDRKDGKTLLQEMEAAYASAPDAIGLISWNEFSENTHMEPSRNYGMRYLEVLAELRGGVVPEIITFDSDEPAATSFEPNLGRSVPLLLLGALVVVSFVVITRRGMSSRTK
ncbi:MAG: hypothetical protein BMS9Abin28_2397 [Anaerolineae bacterium]|nr:MAG: hypothetical protein BMS9Abin28_2397 [Anaerolineae bacterium]